MVTEEMQYGNVIRTTPYSSEAALAKVILVGGPDIDARLELMRFLSDTFHVSALGSQPALCDRFRAEGFDYAAYRLSRGTNPIADLLTAGQLVSIIRKVRPHIVHTFDTKPGVWARLAARLAGVPIVIGTLPGLGSLYADNGLTTRLVRAIYEPLQKLACNISDLTMFQNPADAQQFVSRGIVPTHKALVIPGSGVPTDLLDPMTIPDRDCERVRRELNVPDEALLITMVSRLIRSKGVLEFAKAAQIVREQCPQSEFLLVGPSDGDSVDPLTPAEITALRQAVTWAGERRDVPAVFAASDIVVLPSFYREGIPRVLLEAAAMGLPIVTTDSPGCNDVVKDGLNGSLVPGRDPEALAQSIIRLIESPELRQRYGSESRKRAVERFDMSIIANQIRSVYLRLLADKALLPDTPS